MRTRIVTLAAALAVGLAAPQVATPAHVSKAPAAVVAHKCKSGYTHARIGGKHKCLRRGQYCARRYRKQYRRYGYRCVRVGGSYRLR